MSLFVTFLFHEWSLVLANKHKLFILQYRDETVPTVLGLIHRIPLRAPYSKDPRPRSRSPVYGRDGREPRDSRDARDSGREPRPSSHSRDPDYRYRSSESRDKDLRADPRDPAYR